jgi:uncharacterized OB-fold protein
VNLLHPASVHVPSAPGEEPALVGSRCDACGRVVFPRIPVCPACHRNGTMRDVQIGRTAKLFSHTIARSAPKGFRAPFFQAFVDLPEGPRIFTLIGAECPVEDGALQDGMEMRLVVEQLADTPENQHLATYKYVPASPAKAGRNGARHA